MTVLIIVRDCTEFSDWRILT